MFDMLDHDLHPPQRFSLCESKWKYRGEGNLNLVLALTQERKIVRLRKYESGGVREEEERQRVLRETIFCRCVMVPLLGEAYIQPPTIAYLELMDVRNLDQILRSQRPVSRHHKGLQFSHVTVYPDYALLPRHLATSTSPTFCVEVKPKQGWIPSADRLAKCTFCLNQYLKLQKNTIQSRSQYCPLDLFSGNSARMKCALRHLLASPQNNLKIFEEGELVYGDEVGGNLYEVLQRWLGNSDQISTSHNLIEKFCELVHDALTRNLCSIKTDFEMVFDGEEMQHTPTQSPFERVPGELIASVNVLLQESPCDWSAEQLPQGCILDRILRIQKLEQCGADSIYHMHCACPGLFDLSAMLKSWHNMNPLHRYLLATTAKDCSIMIAFQHHDFPTPKIKNDIPDECVVYDLDGQSHVFNIGVSDLDPKPLSCIEKHRKRDCDILSACLETFSHTSGQVQG